jgi:hypothetical protein
VVFLPLQSQQFSFSKISSSLTSTSLHSTFSDSDPLASLLSGPLWFLWGPSQDPWLNRGLLPCKTTYSQVLGIKTSSWWRGTFFSLSPRLAGSNYVKYSLMVSPLKTDLDMGLTQKTVCWHNSHLHAGCGQNLGKKAIRLHRESLGSSFWGWEPGCSLGGGGLTPGEEGEQVGMSVSRSLQSVF